jgi:hypothetical protein
MRLWPSDKKKSDRPEKKGAKNSLTLCLSFIILTGRYIRLPKKSMTPLIPLFPRCPGHPGWGDLFILKIEQRP